MIIKTVKTIDMGDNTSISTGIYQETDGTFTAMTFTRSKNFKTLKGAERWLERQRVR